MNIYNLISYSMIQYSKPIHLLHRYIESINSNMLLVHLLY